MTRVNVRIPGAVRRASERASEADNECRSMQIGLIEFQSALACTRARAHVRAGARERIRFFGADFCSWLFTTINVGYTSRDPNVYVHAYTYPDAARHSSVTPRIGEQAFPSGGAGARERDVRRCLQGY